MVPKPGGDRFQIGSITEMKPGEDDPLRARGGLNQPREFSLEGLQPPEIVGEFANPLLETVRRLWWRVLDRVCYSLVLIRLSIFDRIFGPEPPTSADLNREADHERLVLAFPVAGKTIEPTNCPTAQNLEGGLGSPYR